MANTGIIRHDLEQMLRLIEKFDSAQVPEQPELDILLEKLRGLYSTLTIPSAVVVEPTPNYSDIVSRAAAEAEKRILSQLSEVVDSIIDRKLKSIETSMVHDKIETVVDTKPKTVTSTKEKEIVVEKNNVNDEVVTELKSEIIESPAVKEVSESKATETSTKILYETIAVGKKNEKTIVDILNNKGGEDLSSRLSQKPVPDLEKAISLNEKFIFIKELFGGNAHLYSQSITKINTMQSIDEAVAFIQSNFVWNYNNAVVESFVNLVKRRFS